MIALEPVHGGAGQAASVMLPPRAERLMAAFSTAGRAALTLLGAGQFSVELHVVGRELPWPYAKVQDVSPASLLIKAGAAPKPVIVTFSERSIREAEAKLKR